MMAPGFAPFRSGFKTTPEADKPQITSKDPPEADEDLRKRSPPEADERKFLRELVMHL